MTQGEKTALECKEEGNSAFRDGNWDKALSCYTEALQISNDERENSVYYKNRAATYLKTGEFENCIKDCTSSLESVPNDPKALFRRCQAYDATEQFEQAYKDARAVHNLQPKNKELQPILERLHKVVADKVTQQSQVSSKVEQMMTVLFDHSMDGEKRETMANNLVALSKERSGADLLMKENLIGRMMQMLKTERKPEIILGCVRALSELCKDKERCKLILREVGLPWLIEEISCDDTTVVNAAQYLVQTCISTLSGISSKTSDKNADKLLLEENVKELDSIMYILVTSCTNRRMSGFGRDAVLEIIMKNMEYKTGLDWSAKLLKMDGMAKLLEVGSELQEYPYESAMNITNSTRQLVAFCLQKVHDGMCDDIGRQKFTEKVDEFIRNKLMTPDHEGQVRTVAVITTLLMGPIIAGNFVLAKEGIMEMMLTMANSDDVLMQKVSCEALIAAASKKDKCQAILSQGLNILKKLYNSKDDSIKVRALVGMCKLGSMAGTDASLKPFAEGASLKLAEACRRFLINPSKDKDMRRWACEGLSYLTLDAEVKEKLVEDRQAVQSMIDLAKSGDLNVLYGVVTTLVNLTNCYDKQEIIPEMLELAKFAKHHIPEEHEFDDKDFVDQRIEVLAQEGVCHALVALSKTESQNSRELIARIFNAVCEQQNLRGACVQAGGSKCLLDLAETGTKKGKIVAAQALARMAITMNPEVAFPGQRSYEVVRPMLNLLHPDCSGLENFESLMALCNIASVSESIRQRIIKEGGINKIENYLYEPHDLIRRAAVQCMTNMCCSPDMVKILEGKSDRLKYLVLMCADEDEAIVMAAAGALAMVTSDSVICCRKVMEALDWENVFKFLLSHSKIDIAYRGTVIVYNVMRSDKYIAEKMIDSHIKTALEALSKIDHPEKVLPQAKENALKALDVAKDWKLYKHPDSEDVD